MISKIKNFLTLSFLIAIAGLATIIFTVTLIYPTLPDVESLSKYRPKEPLQIFTKDNYLIQEFGEERRDFIAIENVPQKMINAILAIEDRRFFEHPGIDLIGIIRAAVKNFTGQSREGASTITMQVARNFFLSSEKTFKRKINEILLSLKIENKLSKEEAEDEYTKSEKGLRYQLIESKIIDQNDIKIDLEQIKNFSKELIKIQMKQYGQNNPDE